MTGIKDSLKNFIIKNFNQLGQLGIHREGAYAEQFLKNQQLLAKKMPKRKQ